MKGSKAIVLGALGLTVSLLGCGRHHKDDEPANGTPAAPGPNTPVGDRQGGPGPKEAPPKEATPAKPNTSDANKPKNTTAQPTPPPSSVPARTPPRQPTVRPPTPAEQPALQVGTAVHFDTVTPITINVVWGAAVARDEVGQSLKYKLVCTTDTTLPLATLDDMDKIKTKAQGLIFDGLPDLTSYELGGLQPATTYLCNVAVTSAKGLRAVYTPGMQTTPDQPGIGLVAITLPEGRDSVVQNQPMNITWVSRELNGSDPLNLYYSADEGASWSLIAAGVLNTGTYEWTPTVAPGTKYKIRVTLARDATIVADSKGDFSVIAAH